jgi:ankyrin repeat protein
MLFFSFGVNANELDRKYEKIYSYLYEKNNDKVVNELSSVKNLDYVIDERAGRTLLTESARLNDFYLVKYLVSHKADINLPNGDMYTALIFSVKNDNADIFNYLVDNKADVCVVDKQGLTVVDMVKGKKIENIVKEKYSQSQCDN